MFKRWLSINTEKSVLLLGPRRSGKTTFVKNMFPSNNYITLDDMDYLNWAKKDPKGVIAIRHHT
ncbi:MAG: AAA family ATPase, partial [Spirochaetes bacterium]|nr:AAA family ATPase [Spirochaetota bacterium]